MTAGNLPDDILEDILCRLPVKSLIKLTIICKSWLALITSQSFTKTHLSRTSANLHTHSLLLHACRHNTARIFPLNFSGIAPTSVAPARLIRDKQSNTLSVVGSINGLVCFSNNRIVFRPSRANYSVIWNPATHKFKDILFPDMHVYYNVGFGFDSVVNDYKVVGISRIMPGNNMEKSYRFCMYSCNANSWKELKLDFPFHLDTIVGYVVVKGGNPYWMGYYNENVIVVSVNVRTEVIRVFSGTEYAKNVAKNVAQKPFIMNIGDSIAQILYLPDTIDVYTLEENSGVWTKMYTMEMESRMCIPRRGRPYRLRPYLECYKNGKFMIKAHKGKLFVYDPISKEMKDLGIGEGTEAYYRVINYTESLVDIGDMERSVAEEARQETALTTSDRYCNESLVDIGDMERPVAEESRQETALTTSDSFGTGVYGRCFVALKFVVRLLSDAVICSMGIARRIIKNL